MIDTNERRLRTGEFYTPLEYARLGLQYLQRVVGDLRQSEFRLWDPAAGTGNLERVLPPDFLPNCFISTLLDDDVAHCRQLFRSATVFQFDFLNDGEEKLPPKLRADLQNPELKWIILINPPYVTANNFERAVDKISKDAVSMTRIRQQMTADGMGLSSRELFSQFLYRIDRLFRDRAARLAMFSKLKYINAANDQKLRDRFFDYAFEGGFVFSSTHFHNTTGKFPVGFLIWNLARHAPLSNQRLELDVIDERLERIAIKRFESVSRGELLNNWFAHPNGRKKFPPLSNALTIGRHQKNRCDRIADGFLASLMSPGNDMMHQKKTALLSGPYVSAGAFSITPENFEQCMVVHAVRGIPKLTWLNDRDQFCRPTKKLPREFVVDCAVWSLFCNSNYTAAMSNVEYEGEVFQIENRLYPWGKTRFAARWLQSETFSPEASEVLKTARRIYEVFFARLNELDRKKFRLETRDVGWYQVRRSLEDAKLLTPELREPFRAAHEKLRTKILPQIHEYGFLRDEVIYFD